jgi:hypothetical protein
MAIIKLEEDLMVHPHIQYHVSAFGREFLLAISN